MTITLITHTTSHISKDVQLQDWGDGFKKISKKQRDRGDWQP